MAYTIREWTKSKRKGWEIDLSIALPNRKIHRERYRAKSEFKSLAEQEAKDRERYLIKNGTEDNNKQQIPKLNDYFDKYINNKKKDEHKPSYYRWLDNTYNSRIKPELGDYRLDEITTEVIADFRRDLRATNQKGKQLSKITTNNILTLLGMILNSAHREKLLIEVQEIQMFKIEIKKIKADGINCYSEEQFNLLVNAAKKLNNRIHLLILLGGDAGLRCGEILGLMPQDIDFERKTLTVNRSIWKHKSKTHITTPKSGKVRTIPLSNRLNEALRNAVNGPYILSDEEGGSLTIDKLRTWIRGAQGASGLTVTGGIHVLRRAFCSRLAMRGVPVKVIQSLAGHAFLTTTERYCHSDDASEQKAIGMLGEL